MLFVMSGIRKPIRFFHTIDDYTWDYRQTKNITRYRSYICLLIHQSLQMNYLRIYLKIVEVYLGTSTGMALSIIKIKRKG